METKNIIPIVGIGGALALILYIASKNRNPVDTGTMPYGWGSFQNSDNPLTPVYTDKPKPTLSSDKPPIYFVPEPGANRPSPGLVPPIWKPRGADVSIPQVITGIPMQSKPMVIPRLWNPVSIRDGIKPVTGKKVI